MNARIPAMAMLMALAPAGVIADVVAKNRRKKNKVAVFKTIHEACLHHAFCCRGAHALCADVIFGQLDEYAHEAIQSAAELVHDAVQDALYCDCVWKRQSKSAIVRQITTHVTNVIADWCEKRGVSQDSVNRKVQECKRRLDAAYVAKGGAK